jgi:hypothetical protein
MVEKLKYDPDTVRDCYHQNPNGRIIRLVMIYALACAAGAEVEPGRGRAEGDPSGETPK